MTNNRKYGILSLPVIVGALGYFVDIYDLLLFTIVREPSLKANVWIANWRYTLGHAR
jgi:hypothetical protein